MVHLGQHQCISTPDVQLCKALVPWYTAITRPCTITGITKFSPKIRRYFCLLDQQNSDSKTKTLFTKICTLFHYFQLKNFLYVYLNSILAYWTHNFWSKFWDAGHSAWLRLHFQLIVHEQSCTFGVIDWHFWQQKMHQNIWKSHGSISSPFCQLTSLNYWT